VQPNLSALNELEMFDGVGHIKFRAIDFKFGEDSIEKLAGGTDEGFTLQIFLIARLLANEKQTRASCPAAPDRLSCVTIEIAPFAGGKRRTDGHE
jgi:hypothetical protein